MITVTRTGPSFAEFSREMTTELKKREVELKSDLSILGAQATVFAKLFIEQHKRHKPGTGNLANAIDFEVDRADKENFNVYIGNISKLDRMAPYWYIVNYGGKVTRYSGNTHFTPGRYFGNTFKYGRGKSGGYIMPSGLKQTVRIRPMNYIEATDRYITKEADRIYSKI